MSILTKVSISQRRIHDFSRCVSNRYDDNMLVYWARLITRGAYSTGKYRKC